MNFNLLTNLNKTLEYTANNTEIKLLQKLSTHQSKI